MATKHERTRHRAEVQREVITIRVVVGAHAARTTADKDLVLIASCRATRRTRERRDAAREEEKVVGGRGRLVCEATLGRAPVGTSKVRSGEGGSLRRDVRPQTDLVHAVPVGAERELQTVPVDQVGVNYSTSFNISRKMTRIWRD